MSIEEALEQLEWYSLFLEQKGDANEAIKNDKDDFLHVWGKLNQYFSYIIKNADILSDEVEKAVNILLDMSENNPSLKEWVEMITNPKAQKSQTPAQNNTDIDTATISGPIESLINEVKNMQMWDSDHVEDLEWELREYQQKLAENQSSFDPNLFNSLMNDINAALHKIQGFYNIINSETVEGIKRM